jgi:hypothetical protein
MEVKSDNMTDFAQEAELERIFAKILAYEERQKYKNIDEKKFEVSRIFSKLHEVQHKIKEHHE